MVPWASAKDWVGREVFEVVPLHQQARLLGLLIGEVCWVVVFIISAFGRNVCVCGGGVASLPQLLWKGVNSHLYVILCILPWNVLTIWGTYQFPHLCATLATRPWPTTPPSLAPPLPSWPHLLSLSSLPVQQQLKTPGASCWSPNWSWLSRLLFAGVLEPRPPRYQISGPS